MLMGAGVLISACGRETPASPPSGRIEYLIAHVGTETKATVAESGSFSWEAGDVLAVHTDAGKYKLPVIATTSGGFNVPLLDGESRNCYAVYPASVVADSDGTPIAGLSHADGLDVQLPSSYMLDLSADNYAWQTRLPLVALNDPASTELYFHHAGALLRITVNHVPASSVRIDVALNTVLNGKFSVTNANTGTPSIVSSGAVTDARKIISYSFDELSDATDGIVLNVPVPPLEVSSVSIYAYDASHPDASLANLTVSGSLNFARAHGKHLVANLKDGKVYLADVVIDNQDVIKIEGGPDAGWDGNSPIIWDGAQIGSQLVTVSTYYAQDNNWDGTGPIPYGSSILESQTVTMKTVSADNASWSGTN